MGIIDLTNKTITVLHWYLHEVLVEK
jgi:hypothetical protein